MLRMVAKKSSNTVIEQRGRIMFKRTAELVDDKGVVVAAFNETCHDYRSSVATVRLRAPLAPFLLQGTESLAIFAKGSSSPVISVEASDPAGTEIREFHGITAVGCIPEGTGISLVKNPGGDLSTLLIVLGTGTVEARSEL
jgi:hypothetical protein